MHVAKRVTRVTAEFLMLNECLMFFKISRTERFAMHGHEVPELLGYFLDLIVHRIRLSSTVPRYGHPLESDNPREACLNRQELGPNNKSMQAD